jgi:hypothetical protein
MEATKQAQVVSNNVDTKLRCRIKEKIRLMDKIDDTVRTILKVEDLNNPLTMRRYQYYNQGLPIAQNPPTS